MLSLFKQDPFLHIIFIFVSLIFVLLIGLIGFFVYEFASGNAFKDEDRSIPVEFSLNDYHAKYTIQKNDYPGITYYSVVYTPDDPSKNYYMNTGNIHEKSLDVVISNSKVNLEPYVGKNVKIDGAYNYYFSKTQCIQGVCKNLGFPAQIDINSLQQVQ